MTRPYSFRFTQLCHSLPRPSRGRRLGKILRPPEYPFQRLPRLLSIWKSRRSHCTFNYSFDFVTTQNARAILDFREKQHEMRQPDSKVRIKLALAYRMRELLKTLTPQHQLYDLVTMGSCHKNRNP